MLHNAAIAAGVVGGGLLIGMTGYHRLGGLGWVDSFYYASMILAGEGPPADPQALTGAALLNLHLFAGFYALRVGAGNHHDVAGSGGLTRPERKSDSALSPRLGAAVIPAPFTNEGIQVEIAGGDRGRRSTSVPGILFREVKHGIPLGRADFLNGESVPLLE